MIGPVAVSLGGVVLVRDRAEPIVVVVVSMAAVTIPIQTGACLVLWWAVRRFRSAARVAATRRAGEVAALDAADLVGLGLAGGLSVAAAHEMALEHAAEVVVSDLRSLVAMMTERGVTAALDADRSAMAGSSAVLAAASASGAPVLPALQAFVAGEHHRRHLEAVERARRLPIRLLIPLTLLVLPGFVLITVGPTVIDSLARLAP